MRGVADSLILATTNVWLTVLAYLTLRTAGLEFVGMVISIAVVPLVLVATLFFVVRDFRKAGVRGQALMALILSMLPAAFRLSLGI